ncbi:MAG TPA: UDP binding domain-containing protein, partial [Victivallales bacterium]|nr:UDP binding domain-containing protein [Victivallales bacterium]
IYVAKKLIEENAIVSIFDPKAIENAKTDLAEYKKKVSFFSNYIDCVRDAHAILILTDWKEFAEYDYKMIYGIMNKPAFIFDGRNVIDREALFKIGFNVCSIGKEDLLNL